MNRILYLSFRFIVTILILFTLHDNFFAQVKSSAEAGDDASAESKSFQVFNFVTADVPNVSDGEGSSTGLNWIDFDNNGWQDLFVTNGNSEVNFLYRNAGSGDSLLRVFSNDSIVNNHDRSRAATWGDFDNDGDLDAFIVNRGGGNNNVLYRNEIPAIPQFRQINFEVLPSEGCSWGDINNDGYLDLLVSNRNDFNKVYVNNRNGELIDTIVSPITSLSDNLRGCAMGDYNNDGLLDIFIANNSGDNYLFQNLGNLQFADQSQGLTGAAESQGGSWGDYDNDGDLDLFVSNNGGENNVIYRNEFSGGSHVGFTAIILNDGDNTLGSCWGDFDNDGDLDLYIANDDANTNNIIYLNNGPDPLQWLVFSGNIPPVNDESESRGVASADFDNDGDLDIMVANIGTTRLNLLYENTTNTSLQRAIKIRLFGLLSNCSAIGTRVKLKANINGQPVWQTREVSGQTGYSGQNSLIVHFGLGETTLIDSIIVEWSNSDPQVLTGITWPDAESTLEIIEDVDAPPRAPTNLREFGTPYPYPAEQECFSGDDNFGSANEGEVSTYGVLEWDDNSINEDCFSVRIAFTSDSTQFFELGRAPANATTFSVNSLEHNVFYWFQVVAVNAEGESAPSTWKICSNGAQGDVFPTATVASARSQNSILVTWKDNADDEFTYLVERRSPNLSDIIIVLPANSRFYLDTNLDTSRTYHYAVATGDAQGRQDSDFSNTASESPTIVTSIVQHGNGLEVDNQGGGADGWSHLPVENTNIDRLYDGHLQIWVDNSGDVYDGDESDFVANTGIQLYPPGAGKLYEHSASPTDPNLPVVFRSFDSVVEIEQFTYFMPGQNWLVADWTVSNTSGTAREIKTALFFDADAEGSRSSSSIGRYDFDENIVYTSQEVDNYIGMTLFDVNQYENFQINQFRDMKTPDTIGLGGYRNQGGGETARIRIFDEDASYVPFPQNGNSDVLQEDLAMTLVSSLGMLSPGEDRRIFYIIATGNQYADLRNEINSARQFIQSVAGYIVSGTVNYQNAAESPIENAVVTAGNFSATTNSNGMFQFSEVPPGNYTISTTKSSGWGGANATDALLAMRHFVGLEAIPPGLQLLAADVNNNAVINATDALQIAQRFVGSRNSFEISDWLFTDTLVQVPPDISAAIWGIAAGDINGSYIPNTAISVERPQTVPNLLLEEEVVTEVPIMAGQKMTIGAISLVINYPENLLRFEGIASHSIKDILVNGGDKGQIKIAWFDQRLTDNPLVVEKDEMILSLLFKPLKSSPNKINLTLENESEIAGRNAKPLKNVKLKIPEVLFSNLPKAFNLYQNYPNPFNPSTTFRYDLKSSAKVRLVVYNILGQQVAKILDINQSAGVYQILWQPENLPSGIYLYQINIDSEEGNYVNQKKLLLLK